MSDTKHILLDTNGRAITGDVTIRLRPGIGVTGPTGEHLEDGPHTVPVAFAAPLLSSHRASVVAEAPAPVDPAAQVPGAPAGVLQRDPAVTTREGAARKKP